MTKAMRFSGRRGGDGAAGMDKGKAPKGPAKIAHEALFETIGDKGLVPPPDPHIPAGRKCAALGDWRCRSIAKGICASINDKSRQRAFERAAQALVADDRVDMWESFLWIISI